MICGSPRGSSAIAVTLAERLASLQIQRAAVASGPVRFWQDQVLAFRLKCRLRLGARRALERQPMLRARSLLPWIVKRMVPARLRNHGNLSLRFGS